MKIQVDRDVMRHYVPGSIFSQSPFVAHFRDVRGCDAERQANLIQGILPGRQYIACIGDTFADPKAGRYFATFLLERINARSRTRVPMFATINDTQPDEYTGVVYAPEQKVEDIPAAIVISFGTTITDTQAERARDLIAKFDTPVLVQCSNMNPLVIANRIHKPCHFPFWLGKTGPHQI